MSPSGTPTATAKSIARIVSSMVVGRRSTRSVATGRECLMELPRSPAGELLEVAHELDGDRLVEPVAVDEVVAHGVGRPLAEDRPAGVARDDPSEPEHDEGDPKQHRDRDEKPANDELDHRWSAPLRSFTWWEIDGGAASAAPPIRHVREADGSGGGRRVEETAPQAGEVLERAGAALVQRVLGIPLDRVAEDDVVGVEVGAVVELHAVTQRAGPGRGVGVRRALGGEGRDGRGAADLVGVQGLVAHLAGAEALAVRLVARSTGRAARRSA